MVRRSDASKRRAKGSIETLPSGALRISVYAGIDPISGRRHYLRETVEPGPRAARDAEAARTRLVSQVAERRNPRTSATVDQLLERYLDQFDGAPNTLTLYRGYVRNHIAPFLGHLKVGQVDAEIMDSFYAELRRCRTHCTSKRQVDHRTSGPHECDDRCGPHRCRPLSATTVRHMHFILSGAFKRAVRWRWVSVSPIGQAEPPAMPKPNPEPPSPAEAARILGEAWRNPSWGALLWVAMTTGVRRGELCAIRWSSVGLDPERPVIWLRRAIRKDADGRLVEAELKTHQQRRIALDAETVAVLVEHRTRCEQNSATLGLELRPEAFVFSPSPDGSEFPKPDSVTQRYERLAARLAIRTTIHKLRHYAATELISAGVDIRTVAGRLGHGGGGATTLRVYTAWVSEADQRAAVGIGAGMPTRPGSDNEVTPRHVDPRFLHEKVAADSVDRINREAAVADRKFTTVAQPAEAHDVAIPFARRDGPLLEAWDLAQERKVPSAVEATMKGEAASAENQLIGTHPAQFWTVTLRGPDGFRYPSRIVAGDMDNPDTFRSHLLAIARVENPDDTDSGETWISRYELEIFTESLTREQFYVLRW